MYISWLAVRACLNYQEHDAVTTEVRVPSFLIIVTSSLEGGESKIPSAQVDQRRNTIAETSTEALVLQFLGASCGILTFSIFDDSEVAQRVIVGRVMVGTEMVGRVMVGTEIVGVEMVGIEIVGVDDHELLDLEALVEDDEVGAEAVDLDVELEVDPVLDEAEVETVPVEYGVTLELDVLLDDDTVAVLLEEDVKLELDEGVRLGLDELVDVLLDDDAVAVLLEEDVKLELDEVLNVLLDDETEGLGLDVLTEDEIETVLELDAPVENGADCVDEIGPVPEGLDDVELRDVDDTVVELEVAELDTGPLDGSELDEVGAVPEGLEVLNVVELDDVMGPVENG
nr:hypothetical protein CFP56_00787 [Quercus suber]